MKEVLARCRRGLGLRQRSFDTSFVACRGVRQTESGPGFSVSVAEAFDATWPGVQTTAAVSRTKPADRGADSSETKHHGVPAHHRCQSAAFHSSESQAFIRTPFRVFACAETLARQMSGIM